MKLSDFDFELPSNLIAQNPAYPRDTSKMLIINQNKVDDRKFFDLPNFITKNDLVICNNTKVLASRLEGSRNNTSIQIQVKTSKFQKESYFWVDLYKNKMVVT